MIFLLDIAEDVWKTSRNLRGVIKIAKMAKSVEGVEWLGSTFLDTQC
jgi:hypothetical protein